MTMNESIDVNDYDFDCAQNEPVTDARFIFVMIASLIAFVGVCKNAMLVITLLQFRCHHHSNNKNDNLYTIFLALLDALLCIAYIYCFGVDAFAIYYRVEAAFEFWHAFILPIYFMSKIVQLAIPYMLIAATFERFIVIVGNNDQIMGIHHRRISQLSRTVTSRCYRRITVFMLVLGAFLFRIPFYIAIEVKEFMNCSDAFNTKMVGIWEEFYFTPHYRFYEVYLVALLQVFIPFCLLLLLNIVISGSLSRQMRLKAKQQTFMSEYGQKHMQPIILCNEHIALEQFMSPSLSWKNRNPTASFKANALSTQVIITNDESLASNSSVNHTQAIIFSQSNITRSCSEQSLNIDDRLQTETSTDMKFENLDHSKIEQTLLKQNTQERLAVRESMITMIVIVTTYLCCNFLYVLLTIMEYNQHSLVYDSKRGTPTEFQMLFADTISFLFMFCSSMRIWVYVACNHQIRDGLLSCICMRKLKKVLL